jgi:hypothetical protein
LNQKEIIEDEVIRINDEKNSENVRISVFKRLKVIEIYG